MANETTKFVSLNNLKQYDENAVVRMENADAEVLKQAKEHAESYANGLAENYDPAGTAETKVKELADSAVKANTEAIAAEKERAELAEKANADAIAAVKEDVDAFFSDADMTESAKDTLKELQEYIASDETGAAAMAASIKQNADAIDAVEGRMTTVEGAVATKVEQEAYNTKVAELEGADEAIEGRLDDIEAVLGSGEGSVADQIATAKEEAIAEAVAKDTALEIAIKEYVDAEDAKVETRVEALETVSATHALKTEVEAVAGNVDTLEADMEQAKTDIATKATTADLEAEATRAQQKEAELEAAIGAFVEADETDIENLFK